MKSDQKLLIKFIIIIAIFFAGIGFYTHFMKPNPFGNDFTLTDSNGKQVTQADIRAQPSAIFFGYTMCPDVCPTTLLDITDWLEALGPDANKIKIWFFTVDPERDTPQVMHDYISNLSKQIIGISGDPQKVHDAIKSFNIVAEKVPSKDGNYTYDHSAGIILLNKGGRVRTVIPYQQNREVAIEWLKQLAQSAGN